MQLKNRNNIIVFFVFVFKLEIRDSNFIHYNGIMCEFMGRLCLLQLMIFFFFLRETTIDLTIQSRKQILYANL